VTGNSTNLVGLEYLMETKLLNEMVGTKLCGNCLSSKGDNLALIGCHVYARSVCLLCVYLGLAQHDRIFVGSEVKMAAIVFIKHPTWFQRETSVAHDGYVRVYRFGFNVGTTCALQDGTKLDAFEALEGSLNGWYECRRVQAEDRNSKGRILKYIKDNSTLEAALGATAILLLCAFSLGKE
jgi:hypothetical protein